ncbi:hypothetical protein PG995_015318 [Apiospora arundinis]
MSHQRYPSMDPVKEPHSVSLKVLRLSRPSPSGTTHSSCALRTTINNHKHCCRSSGSRIPRLPVDRRDEPRSLLTHTNSQPPAIVRLGLPQQAGATSQKKSIREVKIEAEMKTPGSATVQKLTLGPSGDDHTSATQETEPADSTTGAAGTGGVDLDPGQTLQKIVNFDLKEEGNHVLAVTVSYYEATETSGRTRTFRKLYQFVCKGSLIVRTKVGPLPYHNAATTKKGDEQQLQKQKQKRRWIMEAQLENCSEDAMQLERVVLHLETGLRYRDANWIVSESARPVLHPGRSSRCASSSRKTARARRWWRTATDGSCLVCWGSAGGRRWAIGGSWLRANWVLGTHDKDE